MDSQNHMSNIFWSDDTSKTDYGHFGDMIVFDTTYRTNKYNMICAPYIGESHHRQKYFIFVVLCYWMRQWLF